MRKLTAKVTALFLSLLIISMSVGVATFNCAHKGNLSMAQYDKMSHGCNGCAPMQERCVTVTVSKLSPTHQPPLAPDFHIIQPVLFVFSDLYHLSRCTVEKLREHFLPPSLFDPPRAYLRLISVLII